MTIPAGILGVPAVPSASAAAREPAQLPVIANGRHAAFAGRLARAMESKKISGDASDANTVNDASAGTLTDASADDALDVARELLTPNIATNAAAVAHPKPARTSTDAIRTLVNRVAGMIALTPNEPAPAMVMVGKPPVAAIQDEADAAGDQNGPTKSGARPPSETAIPVTVVTPNTVDPATVVHDLSALQPAFREKLNRVVARMKDEFNQDVSVIETYRSQARQDHLFEQGRTREGSVVTWTHNSRHTEGLAADIVVSGTANRNEGYRRLAQIANDEGLHTLGPMDPGHVELQSTSALDLSSAEAKITEVSVGGNVLIETIVPVASVFQVTPGSGVAAVARIASVAQVAAVASVARVAMPGMIPRSVTAARAPSADRDDHAVDGVQVPQDAIGNQPSTMPAGKSVGQGEMRAAIVTAERQQIHAPAIPPMRRIDAVDRATQVLAIQDAKDAQPVSHMTLRFDNADGGEDRVRVGLRGINVGATIDVHDGTSATQMSSRLLELATALESRGLEAGTLRVRSAAAVSAVASIDLARAATANVDSGSSWHGTLLADPASTFSRSRDESSGRRPPQDQSQYRSRREQKERTP